MPPGFRFDEAVLDVYGDLRLAPVLRRLLQHTGRLTGGGVVGWGMGDGGFSPYRGGP
jgi:hypothetical protein